MRLLLANNEIRYGRILERLCSHRSRVLSEGEKTQAKKIMAWVICSTRSLKSSQIQSLLAIRSGDKSLNTKMKLIKRLEQLCGPLLEIDHRGVVRIVHYTAKE